MTDRRRFIIGLGLLATLPAVRAQGRGMTPIPAVSPAPTLRLKDTDEKLVDLTQYKGRVVLINFWATWCPPCRKEFPSLDRQGRLVFRATGGREFDDAEIVALIRSLL